MIIHLIGKYNKDEYVVCPRAPITVGGLRERMLQRAKVIEGSYAYRLIDDLHSAIFVQSLDLKADYEAYFACEYESFSEYLRRRERFPPAVVATLSKAIDVSSGIYHFEPSYAFLVDTYGVEFLTRLVEDPRAGEAS
jgi:hypothetical protein